MASQAHLRPAAPAERAFWVFGNTGAGNSTLLNAALRQNVVPTSCGSRSSCGTSRRMPQPSTGSRREMDLSLRSSTRMCENARQGLDGIGGTAAPLGHACPLMSTDWLDPIDQQRNKFNNKT